MDAFAENQRLNQAKEGMTVFDLNRDRIGTVAYVRLSAEDPQTPGAETVTADQPADNRPALVEELAEALNGDQEFPDEVRQYLLRNGFIRVNAGLFQADFYIAGNQISDVTGDHIYLKVLADSLIRA